MDSLRQTQPRSVDVEHVALHALDQLGLPDKLAQLGINGVMRAAILGNIVGRMALPGSELATWVWLQSHSDHGELLEGDFNAMSHLRLYRASHLLVRHRRAIEDHVFGAVQTLLGFEESVIRYDLTNTYFEGELCGNAQAERGRSKEERSDCPLITLGLVLDSSGFVRRSKTFAGNVTDATALHGMLESLEASPAGMTLPGGAPRRVMEILCRPSGGHQDCRRTNPAAAKGTEQACQGGAPLLPLRVTRGQGDGDDQSLLQGIRVRVERARRRAG